MKELQFKTDTQTTSQHQLENIKEACRNLTKTEQRVSKVEDICYMMHYEIPTRYYVSNGLNPMKYQVSDASAAVAVQVEFDIGDPFAGYVFYLDDKGPEVMNSDAHVVLRISQAVDKKLSHWIGDSRRRRSKVVMKASLNQVMQHHDSGIPMAVLSPDLPDQNQNPVEIKKRRVQFQRELNKNVRTVGFGYHQIRGSYVNRDIEADDKVFYILYGKPNKKSEQLLKIIVTELGKKYAQETVGFRDLNGRTSVIFMPDVHGRSHFGDGEPAYKTEDLAVSGAYAPIEGVSGAQISLRRRHAFERYCAACWDEEAQTYHFDQRFDRFF